MEKKIILLVEDDKFLRGFLKEKLSAGYEVQESTGSVEAIRRLADSYHIDLALIDYILSDGNGLDILKTARISRPDLPVIFMTAYSSENLAIEAFRTGVTDYIPKPIDFDYLEERLSAILEEKNNREESGSAGDQNLSFDKIRAYIKENCSDELTRDILAEKVCMSKSQFSRSFNEQIGKNLKSYINEIRVKKAIELLSRDPHMSITDIAVFVGYDNITHFGRVFKEVCGISPNEYRKKYGRSEE